MKQTKLDRLLRIFAKCNDCGVRLWGKGTKIEGYRSDKNGWPEKKVSYWYHCMKCEMTYDNQ